MKSAQHLGVDSTMDGPDGADAAWRDEAAMSRRNARGRRLISRRRMYANSACVLPWECAGHIAMVKSLITLAGAPVP